MKKIPIIALLIAGTIACNKSGTTTTSSNTDTTYNISALTTKFSGNVSAVVQGDYMVITSTDIPDHKSPYFQGTQWDSLYEAYNGTGTFAKNPSSIEAQSITFRIPIHPSSASSKSITPLGPMGVSLNGVPFFNQYAAGRAVLTNEKVSFDQYGGHPQQQGQYHYHVEPTSLTARHGEDAFLGLLLDGFPVYGPMENGQLVTESELDIYHGHTTKTAEFPNGIYHYHVTSTDPYINGSGFYGTQGTVSQ